MNHRQRKRRKARRKEHRFSTHRARTERRYRAEERGLTCVKACLAWFPDRQHPNTCGVCGRKLKKAKAHA